MLLRARHLRQIHLVFNLRSFTFVALDLTTWGFETSVGLEPAAETVFWRANTLSVLILKVFAFSRRTARRKINQTITIAIAGKHIAESSPFACLFRSTIGSFLTTREVEYLSSTTHPSAEVLPFVTSLINGSARQYELTKADRIKARLGPQTQ